MAANATAETRQGAANRPALVLALLTLVYASGYADRNIINLLIDPIKAELGSTDTVLGLVTGFGFTIFHLLFAIPIARIADRTKRLPVLIAGLVLWSGMTTLTGFANGLIWIAVARIGVGIGEACLQGPTHSILSDVYSKDRRPVAFAILSCGAEVGIMAGLLIGGLAAHAWGWRGAFVVAGAPGLVIALALALLVREPARGGADLGPVAAPPPALPLGQSLRLLFGQKSYVLAIMAGAFMGLTVFTIQVWGPSFVRRTYDLNSAQLGTYLAAIRGPAAIAGTLLGGVITQRLGAAKNAWRAWTPAIACALATPCAYIFLAAKTLPVTLAAFGGVTLMIGMQAAPILAMCQSVSPQRTRSLSSALFFFPAQIFGLGFGSALVGWLSDHLAPSYGAESLRYALVVPATAAVLAGMALFVAGRHVDADLQRASASGPQ